MMRSSQIIQQLAGGRSTPTALLGRALVLLLFGFVLSAMAAHGLSLAQSFSVALGASANTTRVVPGALLNSAAMFLVFGAAVVLIRRRFLQERSGGGKSLDVPPSFMASASTEVSGFLGRFLPGLANLRLRMSPPDAPLHASRDTLFLTLGILPSLARMTSVRERAPEQAVDQSKDRATFMTLAHEEFHQLCFDAHTDATFRALSFVHIMMLVPIFNIVLTTPLTTESTWATAILAPIWFPVLMWIMLWGLHGGSHLLEHLADTHADQRVRTPEALPEPVPQISTRIEERSAPVYVDSRGHHPRVSERLAFVRTLETQAAGRIIFFQTLILFTLGANEGVARFVESYWEVPVLAFLRLGLLSAVVLCSLLFSAVVGALAPLRHAVLAVVFSGLFLLVLHLRVADQDLALDSAWLLVALAPALGQWGGRVFLRHRVAPWMLAGTASPELPLRAEQAVAAEEALLLALKPGAPSKTRLGRFQRLLDVVSTHGRFFDAVFATALSFVIVITLADYIPRSGSLSGVFFVAILVALVGVYFTRWSSQRWGIFVLWCARMIVLALAVLLGAFLINLVLYILESRADSCAGAPSLQLCVGQILMSLNEQRLQDLIKETLDMVGRRCDEAKIIPQCLLKEPVSPLTQLFILLRCAFHTPGHLIGPLFLGCASTIFFFDTGLSALRWLGARRPSRP